MNISTKKKVALTVDEVMCLRSASAILKELDDEINGETDYELLDLAEELTDISLVGEWTVEY